MAKLAGTTKARAIETGTIETRATKFALTWEKKKKRLNTHLAVPEIVVIGKRGHGKTSLIEAFFGEPIGAVGTGVTRRPVYYNFLNNSSLQVPRIILKRDTHNKEFDRDVEGKTNKKSLFFFFEFL